MPLLRYRRRLCFVAAVAAATIVFVFAPCCCCAAADIADVAVVLLQILLLLLLLLLLAFWLCITAVASVRCATLADILARAFLYPAIFFTSFFFSNCTPADG